jgi:carbon storage regulator
MLVLTRRQSEGIVMTDPQTGETIHLMVTEIRGDKVRIGITAPDTVTILRDELQLRVVRQESPALSFVRSV